MSKIPTTSTSVMQRRPGRRWVARGQGGGVGRAIASTPVCSASAGPGVVGIIAAATAAWPGIARAKPIPAQLLRYGEVFEKLHGGKYGYYPQTHPLVRYVNELARRLTPGRERPPAIRVTIHDPDLNGFALPHGTIVLTDRILTLCQYEDEVVALLAHEMRHLREAHHVPPDSGMPSFRSFMADVGLSRLHEWEADLIGSNDLMAAGCNPYAGALLQYRLALATDPHGTESDLAHGSSLDRGLNVAMTLALVDYGAATETMRPLPEAVRAHQPDRSLSPYDRLTAAVTFDADDVPRAVRLQTATSAPISALRAAAAELAVRYRQDRGLSGPAVTAQAADDRAVLTQICRRLIDYVERMTPGLTGDVRLLVTGTWLAVECGVALDSKSGVADYCPMLVEYDRLVASESRLAAVARQWTKRLSADLDGVGWYLDEVRWPNNPAVQQFKQQLERCTAGSERRVSRPAVTATTPFDEATCLARAGQGDWAAVDSELAKLSFEPLSELLTRWSRVPEFDALPWLVRCELMTRGMTRWNQWDTAVRSNSKFRKGDVVLSPLTASADYAEAIDPVVRAGATRRLLQTHLDPGDTVVAAVDALTYLLWETTGRYRRECLVACVDEFATHLPQFWHTMRNKKDVFLDSACLTALGNEAIEDVTEYCRTPGQARYLLYLLLLSQSSARHGPTRDALIPFLLNGLPTAEAGEFLLSGPHAGHTASLAAAEEWIDTALTAPQAIVEAGAAVMRTTRRLATDGADDLGTALVLRQFMRGKKRGAMSRLRSMLEVDWMALDRLACSGLEVVNDLERWEEEELGNRLFGLTANLRALYPPSRVQRIGLARTVLTGSDGLLRTPDGRRELVDLLLATIGNGPADVVLRQVVHALAREADLETLYLAIAPAVEARLIGNAPDRPRWSELVGIVTDSLGADVRRRLVAKLEALEKSGNILDEVFAPWRTVTPPAPPPATALELAVAMGSKAGPVAVRGFQVLGQLLALTPEETTALAGVYDDQPGQSKLTAGITLDREWPAWRDEVAALGRRIGAGSLFTVFHARMADGTERVIKVRNPNVEFMLRRTYRTFEQTVAALAAAHGGGYARAARLLPSLREWVERDLHDTGFLERDARFAARHRGFTIGGRYRLAIPRSFGPENRYVRQEAFVAGTNLTQPDALRAAGHDLKAIVALIARNYAAQILDGLVHSDVHPGNFRVTPEGEVAILDRHFYLQLTPDDRQYIMALVIPGTRAEQLAAHTARYFGIQDDAITAQLTAAFAEPQTDQVDRMQRVLQIVHAAEVTVPLTITLLMKNLNGLSRMAANAGFATLAEAFAYAPA